MYWKSFRKTFYVILLSLLAGYAGTFIDTVIIANAYGTVAIAAVGLANPFICLVETFGAGISAGVQTMCGRNLGSGKIKTANAYLFTSFIIVAIISACILFAINFYPQAFVNMLVDDDIAPEMSKALLNYVQGYAYGIPFIILVTTLIPIMQMDSDNSKAYISIAILCVTNVCADLFVVFFVEGADLFDIALATDVAYFVDVVFLFTHFFKKNIMFKLSFYKVKVKYFGNIGLNSLPALLNRISTTLRTGNINWAVFYYAKEIGIVANSTYSNFGTLLSAFPKAFGQSTLLSCSVVSAEKEPESLKRLFKTALINGITISIIIGLIFSLLSQFIIMIYLDPSDPAFNQAINAFILYCISLFIYSINTMFINFYQSIGKVKYSALLNVLDNLFFIALLTWTLPLHFGITGAWAANIFGKLCTTIFMYIVACLVNKKLVFKLEKLMLLPRSFYDNDKKLSFTDIATIDDSARVSSDIQKFCAQFTGNKQKAFLSALAVEELLNNIVKYGFKAKNNTVEVKVSVDNDKIHILLKDNCKRFDPTECATQQDTQDPAKNIGIRLVRNSADMFTYERLINLNYLHIEF